jgi:sulfur-oxidizing protein SoxZ
MATGTIKIRATLQEGVTTVKALISHEMETGLRKNKDTNEVYPAHFIQAVKAEVNGKALLTCNWGGAVSKNPFLSFKFKGAKAGDKLTLSWTDNTGDTDQETAAIVTP